MSITGQLLWRPFQVWLGAREVYGIHEPAHPRPLPPGVLPPTPTLSVRESVNGRGFRGNGDSGLTSQPEYAGEVAEWLKAPVC